MKDNDVLQSIDTAYDESKCLLDSALLITTNEIGGDVRVPTSFMNSSFGMWLYTDGLSLAKKPWFDSVVGRHQQVYGGYSKLFHGAKNNIELSELFTDFEDAVKSFHEKLDEVKKDFSDDVLEPEPVSKQKEGSPQVNSVKRVKADKPKVNIVRNSKDNFVADKGLSKTEALLAKLQNQKKAKEELSASSVSNNAPSQEPKNDLPDEYLGVRDELQIEAQNQLELKQELIEQELVQVKDRQKLFTKTITQLDYHHLLKEKESKFAIKSYEDKLSQNSILKEKKLTDLKDIKTKREDTQQEFEAMELASIEFEKVNVIERAEEKERVEQLDQEKNQVEKNHKKVINQQIKKKKMLDGLRKRVQQAEKELDGLIDDESVINNAQEIISNKKLKIQHEIEDKLVKQYQDREHYLQLEELKFQSLQRVKKQYYLTQQEILHLDHEQQSILQGKKESESFRSKEIQQLQEQRDLKQQMLDVLDFEYKQKELELESIVSVQEKAQLDSESEMEKLFALEF